MANSIIYPAETTYFICYDNDRIDVMAYGYVEPTQQMETGQPIMDTYLNEQEWLLVLIERGIDPYAKKEE